MWCRTGSTPWSHVPEPEPDLLCSHFCRSSSPSDERICKESTPDEIGDVFCTVKLGIDASSVRLEVIDTLGGQDSDTVNFGMIPTDSPSP